MSKIAVAIAGGGAGLRSASRASGNGGAALASQSGRKPGSRERLLVSAAGAFCASGYFPVSIEDIASAAGVSRMTFYRYFGSKAAIAIELFRQNTEAAKPRLLAIAHGDFHDRAAVIAWIAQLFASDREQRQLLRVFTQANLEGAGFTEKAHAFIDELIAALGAFIPAFALDPGAPAQRRRHIEAWLLLYELLDQGNHAARDSGVATDPITIEILAERFFGLRQRGRGPDLGCSHARIVYQTWRGRKLSKFRPRRDATGRPGMARVARSMM